MLQVTRHIAVLLKEKENIVPMPSGLPFNNSQEDEIVEDSEPEREEKRRKWKEVRKMAQGTNALPLSVTTLNIQASPQSDKARPVPHVRVPLVDSAAPLPEDIIIELSGDTVTDETSTTLPSFTGLLLENPADSQNLDQPDEAEIIPREDERPLNLAQFAYNPMTNAAEGRASPLMTGPSVSSARAEPSARSTTRSKWLDCPLTEPQLRKITKCPSCELTWTARKSSQMKWEHIARCAKKNAYTLETLLVRLEQELEAAHGDVDTEPKPRKRKAKAAPVEKEEPLKPDTLLEGVIHKAAPPKRNKKQAVVATVQNVSEAHQLIAEKARNVLAAVEPAFPLPAVVDPQAVLLASLDDAPLVSAQPVPQHHEPIISNFLPPATQAFVPSKLGGALRKLTGTSGSSLMDIPQRPTDLRPSASTYSDAIHDNSSNDLFPPAVPIVPPNVFTSTIDLATPMSSPRQRRRSSSPKQSVILQGDDQQAGDIQPSDTGSGSSESGWEEDNGWGADAVLQWDGEASDASSSPSVALSRVTDKQGKKKNRKRAVDEAGDGQPKKRGRSKKNAAERIEKEAPIPEEQVVEEVEKELRAMIEEDEDLYLRILRYEPMKFDDLLKRALDRGLPERKLKYRLRVFLDKQCINFYTAEPTGPRRRH